MWSVNQTFILLILLINVFRMELPWMTKGIVSWPETWIHSKFIASMATVISMQKTDKLSQGRPQNDVLIKRNTCDFMTAIWWQMIFTNCLKWCATNWMYPTNTQLKKLGSRLDTLKGEPMASLDSNYQHVEQWCNG